MEMKIEVLGPGCPRCKEVEKRTKEVLAELNITAEVIHVGDLKTISRYAILGTPGLVINGKVKSYGRIPTKEEIAVFVKEEMNVG